MLQQLFSTRVASHLRLCLRAGLAVVAATSAQAETTCPKATTATVPGYSVGCGGKGTCLPTDLLEIKPHSTTVATLTAVCLEVLANDGARVADVLSAPGAASAPATVTYSLATVLHPWAHDTGRAKHLTAMTTAPAGNLRVIAVLSDDKKQHFEVPFMIDLRPWWINGTLPLNFTVISRQPHALDGSVELDVPSLKHWQAATQINPTTLALVLDGIRLPAMTPEVAYDASAVNGVNGANGSTSHQLRFKLRRVGDNADSEAAWNHIVELALKGDPHFTVGLADSKGVQVATANTSVVIEMPGKARRYGMPLALLMGGGLAVLFIGLQTRWRWLRDSYGLPADLVPGKLATFSLGRLQMAWWTAVVVMSWFAIGAATGHWLSINESALALMGIGVATAAGAMAVVPEPVTKLKVALDAATAGAARAAAVADINAETRLWTQGWLTDLLSDFGNTDTGLHRLQSFLFTLFFGGWFVWFALNHGAMPTLPTTVLALMGISGSTYVGFKIAAR